MTIRKVRQYAPSCRSRLGGGCAVIGACDQRCDSCLAEARKPGKGPARAREARGVGKQQRYGPWRMTRRPASPPEPRRRSKRAEVFKMWADCRMLFGADCLRNGVGLVTGPE